MQEHFGMDKLVFPITKTTIVPLELIGITFIVLAMQTPVHKEQNGMEIIASQSIKSVNPGLIGMELHAYSFHHNVRHN